LVGGTRGGRAGSGRRRRASTSCGQPIAELLLDRHRVVALGDADAVGDAQHVPIDRQAGHAERVAEHDVGRLAPDAGSFVSASMSAGTCPPWSRIEDLRHGDERLRLLAEEAGGEDLRLELRGVAAASAARRDSARRAPA
jgi:hypothetical protein